MPIAIELRASAPAFWVPFNFLLELIRSASLFCVFPFDHRLHFCRLSVRAVDVFTGV